MGERGRGGEKKRKNISGQIKVYVCFVKKNVPHAVQDTGYAHDSFMSIPAASAALPRGSRVVEAADVEEGRWTLLEGDLNSIKRKRWFRSKLKLFRGKQRWLRSRHWTEIWRAVGKPWPATTV